MEKENQDNIQAHKEYYRKSGINVRTSIPPSSMFSNMNNIKDFFLSFPPADPMMKNTNTNSFYFLNKQKHNVFNLLSTRMSGLTTNYS